jgi:hypothetical protein
MNLTIIGLATTPVKNTSRSGRGKPGGTFAMRSAFIGAKCEIAVNRNIVASTTRALLSHVANVSGSTPSFRQTGKTRRSIEAR